ncbi:hypothetical protein MKK69_22890 [Methylobacterium sp. J-026]|jgi:hypothetical protein|uniref:hypothetical protein n=1 Tax=unclassified Methylobacterium TaxID=2615210 RepID=UPI0011C96810|nr:MULTISPECIES: hypothetical protein [unclassified Methylobacterium]MCJ2136862.1 hypothetical protein [Methylobacterium sp. J-026]TXM71126.1 hypothetical protein FV229_00140 [Methylobacterium sp. WL120]
MAVEIYRAPKAELRRLLDQGEGYASIGRLHGVHENRVRYRATKLGLRGTTQPQGEMPSEALLRLALRQPDLTLKAIAKLFACQAQAIARGAKRYGLPTDRRGRLALREDRS